MGRRHANLLDLMRHVRTTACTRPTAPAPAPSASSATRRFDLAAGFPLLTTKRLHIKSIIHELLWFLKGDTNVRYLHENGVTIWDEWADAHGELGPVYGAQWRSWPAPDGRRIDQIGQIIEQIKTAPDSRRLIVSAWNVGEIERMALPPCHVLFQFYVADGRLSCQLYQRSADIFLGVPFNIASYALLTLMVTQVTGLKPGEFIHTRATPTSTQSFKQTALQLQRTPRPLPRMPQSGGEIAVRFPLRRLRLLNYDPIPASKRRSRYEPDTRYEGKGSRVKHSSCVIAF